MQDLRNARRWIPIWRQSGYWAACNFHRLTAGSFKYSIPDPQRLPSGIPRGTDGPDCPLVSLAGGAICAKSTCDSVMQLSKTYGEIWAPGASSLVSPSLTPMYRSEQHSAKARRPKFTHPGATACVSARSFFARVETPCAQKMHRSSCAT